MIFASNIVNFEAGLHTGHFMHEWKRAMGN